MTLKEYIAKRKAEITPYLEIGEAYRVMFREMDRLESVESTITQDSDAASLAGAAAERERIVILISGWTGITVAQTAGLVWAINRTAPETTKSSPEQDAGRQGGDLIGASGPIVTSATERKICPIYKAAVLTRKTVTTDRSEILRDGPACQRWAHCSTPAQYVKATK